MHVSYFRIFYILLSLAIGALCAWLGAPFVYDNGDAINILITVYTVFAGFLIAIIAILGDPLSIPSGSWRVAENNRERIRGRLIRFSYLFGLYLLTIAIIFVGVLLKKAPESSVPVLCKEWIARLYLFFGSAAFMFSLSLPGTLVKIQQARVDEEIERRRKAEGIETNTPL